MQEGDNTPQPTYEGESAGTDVRPHDRAVPADRSYRAPLVVAVSASSRSAELIARSASRVAAAQRWFVVHIETATDSRMSPAAHATLARNLGLAEQLGAETVILPAVDPVDELLRFARRHGATQIVVGKPRHPWWNAWLGRLSVDRLARRSDRVDICILSEAAPGTVERPAVERSDGQKLPSYLVALGLVAFCTVANLVVIQPYLPLRNVMMVYLLGVVVAARYCGRGPSALATVLSVAMFDFVFVARTGSSASSTTPDAITFGVMLAIGLTISRLTSHVSFQVQAARQREQRMSALFAMSREFATLRSQDEIALAAERHIGKAIAGEALVRLIDERDTSGAPREPPPGWTADEQKIVEWVVRYNERAGSGMPGYPEAPGMYLPLSAAHDCLGVVRVRFHRRDEHPSPERHDLLKTLTSLTAMAIERARSVDAAEQARLDTEAERLRNSLLSAVSHDLRTPLAAIVGSSSTLVELGEQLGSQARRELAESILDEGERLNRQVANLLDMTRLGNGSLQAHKEWQPVEEVVGVVLDRLNRLLKPFPVETRLEPDLPAVPMDERLIQQVLVNLLENAIKYSPAGAPITLSAWRADESVVVEVADRGQGMSQRDLGCAFNRFYRAAAVASEPGVGLGLAICRGIVSLHGGRIEAHNRDGGGLAVRFSLPLPATPRGAPCELADDAVPADDPAAADGAAAQANSPTRSASIDVI